MWSCFEGDLKMSQESPKNITLLDVKNALKDPEFVRKLPENLAPDIQKIQSNPNCSCNIKICKVAEIAIMKIVLEVVEFRR